MRAITRRAVKILLAVFLVVAICQMYLMTKEGVLFLFMDKMFTPELFLSHRSDPVAMAEEAFESMQLYTEKVWEKNGKKLVIKVRKSEEKDLILSDVKSSVPTITVVFDEVSVSGVTTKIFSEMIVNSKAKKLIISDFPKRMRKNGISIPILSSKKVSRSDSFRRLKKKFPDIQYDAREVEFLMANGALMHNLHVVSHFADGKCAYGGLVECRKNFLANGSTLTSTLAPYANHFCERNSELCRKEATWRKTKFYLLLVSLLSSIALGFCLSWVDVKLTFLYFQSLGIFFCSEVKSRLQNISSANKQKVEVKFCPRTQHRLRKVEIQMAREEIYERARRIKVNVGKEKINKDEYLETLFAISTGTIRKNASLNFLNSVLGAIQGRLRRADEESQLEKEEENFEKAPKIIKAASDYSGHKRFQEKKPTEAVSSENGNVVSIDKDDYSLPSYLEVAILAGDRINGKKRDRITEEILLCGAKSVVFYDAAKVREVEAIAGVDHGKFVVVAHLPHTATKRIESSGRRAIFIDVVNPKRFAEEVARAYATSVSNGN